MSGPYRGSCLCGAVRFEVDAFLADAAHCHCRMCRKFHGASFATFATAKRDAFRWLQGEDRLKRYTADNGTTRTFCGDCGSSLSFHSPRANQDEIEITMGTLDDDVPLEPSAHIFVGSAASWTRLTDSLPKHDTERSSPEVKR